MNHPTPTDEENPMDAGPTPPPDTEPAQTAVDDPDWIQPPLPGMEHLT